MTTDHEPWYRQPGEQLASGIAPTGEAVAAYRFKHGVLRELADRGTRHILPGKAFVAVTNVSTGESIRAAYDSDEEALSAFGRLVTPDTSRQHS